MFTYERLRKETPGARFIASSSSNKSCLPLPSSGSWNTATNKNLCERVTCVVFEIGGVVFQVGRSEIIKDDRGI